MTRALRWVVGALAGLALLSPGAAVAQQQWKFIALSPAGQVHIPLHEELAREITEKSDGEIEVTVYPAGELPYKGTEHLKVIERGLVEMGEIFAAANFGDAPSLTLADMPFLALNDEEMQVLRKHMLPLVEETLRERGIELVAWAYYPHLQAAMREPIEGLADFKGRKVRIPGGVAGEFLKLWGAVPTFVVWPEVYPAAQRGVVDGVVTAFSAMETAKLYEVLPYLVRFDGGLNHLYIGVNRDIFEDLSPDLQRVVKEAGANWMERWQEVLVEEADAKAVDHMASTTGNPVVSLSLEERKQTREQMIPILREHLKTTVGEKYVAAFDEVLGELNLQ